MALRFESVGTCLVVRQYLEKARMVLHRDLEQRIQLLFSEGNHQGSLFLVEENRAEDTSSHVEEEYSLPASTGSPPEVESEEQCLV